MRPRKALLVVLLASLCCALGGGTWLIVAAAHADTASPSPSASGTVQPSPTPSGSPSAAPTASPQLVAWATGWHRLAGRQRVRLVRLRACLGRGRLCALPYRPSGDAASGWASFGARCKRLDYRWRPEIPKDLRAILHPHLVSAGSWKPLLVYVGWPPSAIPYAITIMRRESGGRPWASNPSGAAGLFQLARCWWAGRFDPYSPLPNARTALAIWRREGWRPWTSMPEFW